jgi:hypothetical protein
MCCYFEILTQSISDRKRAYKYRVIPVRPTGDTGIQVNQSVASATADFFLDRYLQNPL